MPVKQMSPSFPPFNLDLMRFTPCIMLIWWELDRGSHQQMRVMMRQDLTNQKTNTMTRPFKNLSHWFDEILAEARGLMDKWYIDATKLFLLASMPETPLQMTIKEQKSSGQNHYFQELYLCIVKQVTGICYHLLQKWDLKLKSPCNSFYLSIEFIHSYTRNLTRNPLITKLFYPEIQYSDE